MIKLLALAGTMLLLIASTSYAASFASNSASSAKSDGRTLSDYNIQKE